MSTNSDLEPAVDPLELRALLDKQAITEVLYRFSRAVDREDLDLMRTIFHEDATDDHGVFIGSATDFVEYVQRGWASGILAGSNHVVTNVLIDLDGDVAHVESYFFAHHTWKGRHVMLDDFLGGRYLDRFERRDGVWRIAARRCVWDWGRSDPSTEDSWTHRLRGDYTFGVRGPDDPSYER
jgi:SnoaL-like protein